MLLSALPASAADPPEPCSLPAREFPELLAPLDVAAAARHEAALAALARHRIILVEPDSGRWDPALVEALAESLLRLPPPLRAFPGGPLELASHATPLPFGMGLGTAQYPRWSGGRRRFHLHRLGASDAPTEARSDARLSDSQRASDAPTEVRSDARLSVSQRQRLWAQRALVHAVLQRWDDARGLSRSVRWRRVSGWRGPLEGALTLGEQPRNTFPGAFSRALGRASASLDLVTFAEEFFVPLESLVPEAVAPDDRVVCQEFSKTRALTTVLAEQGLRPPGHAPAEGGTATPGCPAFERWARPEALEAVEVLLVAASGRQPESLFGHLLLRPVYREGDHLQGPGLQSAIQLAAITEGRGAGLRHVWRGLTGGYQMSVFTLPFSDLVEEALHDEQRTIRRFRLRLDAGQRRRVMERAWELERRGYFPYFFLTDNCAALLAFLVEGALEPHQRVRLPGFLLVSPSTALDALAAVTVTDGEGEASLLEYVPEDLEATREQGARSEAQRLSIEAQLLPQLEGNAAAPWRASFDQTRAHEPSRRRAGFQTLAALTRAAPEAWLSRLHAWWAHAARVERDRAERARHVLLELARATVRKDALTSPDVEQQLAARQALFRDERRLAEHPLLIDRTEAERRRLERRPHRADTAEEARQRADAEATLTTFAQLTTMQGELTEQRFASESPVAFLARDRQEARDAQSAWARQALPGSGAWRWAFGAALRASRPDLTGGHARASGFPLLELRSSALAELLGDQRLRGFQSSSELRILDGWTQVELTDGWPHVHASRLTILGYRTLAREPPHLRRGPQEHLGWGMAAELDRRPERALLQRTQLAGELWIPLETSPRLIDFSALGLGLSAGALWGGGAHLQPGIGPRLLWRSRAGLDRHSARALLLEAHAQSTWLPLHGGRWLHEVSANLQLELPLGPTRAPLGVLSPRVSLDLDWSGSGPTIPVPSLALIYEPL